MSSAYFNSYILTSDGMCGLITGETKNFFDALFQYAPDKTFTLRFSKKSGNQYGSLNRSCALISDDEASAYV